MQGIQTLSLVDVCKGLEDPRRDRVNKFSMDEVTFSTMIAVICGAMTFVDIADTAEAKLDWMRKFLPFDNGVPSAGTYRNILSVLNPEKLHKQFTKWTEDVLEVFRGAGVLAVDGKTITGSSAGGSKAAHIVSAFSSAAEMVIGQVACEEKSNEITAIPELLKLLDVHGCLITIDAMGTQRAIAEQIVAQGADFLLEVKGNQKTLLNAAKSCFAGDLTADNLPSIIEYGKTYDAGHGREELRECFLIHGRDWMGAAAEKQPHVKNCAMVRYTRKEKNGKESVEEHYMISSREEMSAEELLYAKRNHWSVENKLHWVLDVQFGEDGSHAHTDHAAENLNAFRHMAYNVLGSVPGLPKGFRRRQRAVYGNNDKLDMVARAMGLVPLSPAC